MLSIPDYVQVTKVDGKYIILDRKKNYLYAVSKTGVELLEWWSILGSAEKAMNKISKKYDVDYGIVEKDMLRLITKLNKKELVRVDDRGWDLY
ncbi:PqqD family peptide modification chaperone [Risungbinella massiliensis]|uniref:PqqD family peptide modification chaperone n=1 Tax=Risungbinella massiliensis TaxID=1329796 RepID=UPI0005CBE4A7|nr:PqqD family peptide modification chaperone [Risungbinella massiliensis]